MTLKQRIYHFLQVDHLFCDYCSKALKFPYLKSKTYPQHMFFTLGHLKQVLFGNDIVMRWCDMQCRQKFFQEGKMKEQVARQR